MTGFHEGMTPHLAVARAKVAEDETGSIVLLSEDGRPFGVIAEETAPRAEVGKVEGVETGMFTVQGLYGLAAACVAVADALVEREKAEPSV